MNTWPLWFFASPRTAYEREAADSITMRSLRFNPQLPVAYNRSVVDGLTSTDVATRAQVLARALAQGITASDVAARQAAHPRATTDALARADAAVGTVPPPVVSNVVITPSASGATVAWDVSPASYGRLEWGTTTAYGNLSTPQVSPLSHHTQSITGMPASTLVHFRIWVNAANSPAGIDRTFTTLSSGATLQSLINAASAGSILDVTGLTFAAGATINKSLTLLNGTINVPVGTQGLTIGANDITIDGTRINGAGASSYNDNERGIYANAAWTGLVIRNTVIDGIRGWGMYLRLVVGAVIGSVGNGNTVTNCGYVGIGTLSLTGGSIAYNTVAHIGEFTSVGGPAPGENNAYGIFVSSFITDPVSTDVTIDHNDIGYVPNWEAVDTHAGVRIHMTNNHVHHSRRSFVCIIDGANRKPTDFIATGNTMDNPYSPGSAAHPEYAGDYKTFLLYQVHNATIQNNTSTGFGGKAPIYDLSGLSDGTLIFTPNSLA